MGRTFAGHRYGTALGSFETARKYTPACLSPSKATNEGEAAVVLATTLIAHSLQYVLSLARLVRLMRWFMVRDSVAPSHGEWRIDCHKRPPILLRRILSSNDNPNIQSFFVSVGAVMSRVFAIEPRGQLGSIKPATWVSQSSIHDRIL
jgi:hypothetical protein